jgi:hypothetical protein
MEVRALWLYIHDEEALKHEETAPALAACSRERRDGISA